MKNKVKLPNITFEVNSLCNLNCKYCYNIWKIPDKNDYPEFNSYRQAKKCLKRLFKIAEINHISFTGGEPMLSERFPETVLYARMKKSDVSIITNGNAGSDADFEQIISLGVTLFELPLHSDSPELHDYMTGRKGSWQNSLNRIKFLLDKGLVPVPVIVITKANYQNIFKTLEFISKLGIKRIMLNRFNIGGRGISERKNLELSEAQLKTAFKQASDAGEKYLLSLSSNVCTPICLLNPSDYKNIVFTSCSAEVTKRPLTLDINGNLRFCNHSPVILGNIFTEDLEDILNSDKAKLWTDSVPDFCMDCNVFGRCMAGCRAASQQLGLSLKTVDPVLIKN